MTAVLNLHRVLVIWRSVLSERFYFRKHMASVDDEGSGGSAGLSHCFCSEVQDFEEMSIAEIMTGKGTYFPGNKAHPP